MAQKKPSYQVIKATEQIKEHIAKSDKVNVDQLVNLSKASRSSV